jgi:hypothetical protein
MKIRTPCALKASFQIFGRGDRTPFRIAPLTESDMMRPYAPPENEKSTSKEVLRSLVDNEGE